MKTLVKVGYYVGVVVFLAFLLSAPLIAFAQEPAPVSVEVAPDGSGAMVGVDLLAGKNAEGKREVSWWKATKAGAWKHKWKIAAGVATAVAVDRVAENNDWLYYEGPDKDTTVVKETKAAPVPEKPSPNSATQSSGGDSTQTVNIYNADNGGSITIVGAAK
jgi:hypothetical protein